MTDLKIIQEVFGNHEVSKKWLINMFEVCRRIRAAEREWVGLTDDDLEDIIIESRTNNLYNLRLLIEAKLKEKNT